MVGWDADFGEGELHHDCKIAQNLRRQENLKVTVLAEVVSGLCKVSDWASTKFKLRSCSATRCKQYLRGGPLLRMAGTSPPSLFNYYGGSRIYSTALANFPQQFMRSPNEASYSVFTPVSTPSWNHVCLLLLTIREVKCQPDP